MTMPYDQLGQALKGIPQRILSLWPLGGGRVFENAYDCARMLQQADVAQGTKLGIVSHSSASVSEGETNASEMATLIGVVRCAPREIPGLSAVLIDIPKGGDARIDEILSEVSTISTDDHVALRQNAKRYLRHRVVSPAKDLEGLPSRLRDGGTYLITGGTGGIGRNMAMWLADPKTLVRKWDLELALGWRARNQSRARGRLRSQQITESLSAGEELPENLIGQRMTNAFVAAQNAFDTPKQTADVTIFKARKAGTLFIAAGPKLGWDRYVDGVIDVLEFDCDHFTMMTEPAIGEIGKIMNDLLLKKK